MMKTVKMVERSSEELLRACREGDRNAFQRLVETCQGYAFSLAIRFLGNEEDAGDIVQETFIRVWKHRHRFDFRCKFTTWLYRIVVNLCYDHGRARNRQNGLFDSNSPELPLQWATPIDLEDNKIKKELAAIIAGLARQLTPRQQAVFVLRDLQDLDVAEVSEILGISKGSVKSNLSLARRNIRDKLRQLESKNGVAQ